MLWGNSLVTKQTLAGIGKQRQAPNLKSYAWSRYLRGTIIFINKDRVNKNRTELILKIKEARRKNQRAFLRDLWSLQKMMMAYRFWGTLHSSKACPHRRKRMALPSSKERLQWCCSTYAVRSCTVEALPVAYTNMPSQVGWFCLWLIAYCVWTC